MIKAALLVVTIMNSAPYETQMPNMVACLEARQELKLQDPDIQAICLPYTPPQDVIKEFLDEFVGKCPRTIMRCEGDDKWPKMESKRD